MAYPILAIKTIPMKTLFLCALTFLSADSFAADIQTDQASGCQVSMSWIKPKEAVTWKGACLNGKAEGEGAFSASNGTMLAGEFKEGKPYNARGKELVSFNSGASTLTAVTYKNGEAFYTALPKTPTPAWMPAKNADCSVWNHNPKPEESVTWEGACVNGKAAGKGIASWFNRGVLSQTNEGEFIDGKWSGKGKLTDSDGRVFDGEFRDS